jgi:hypothetical protein
MRLYLFIVILASSVKLMGSDLRDEDDDEDDNVLFNNGN